jgi:hypothetical protein
MKIILATLLRTLQDKALPFPTFLWGWRDLKHKYMHEIGEKARRYPETYKLTQVIADAQSNLPLLDIIWANVVLESKVIK